jgi:hemerythrin-like metal-binding protein
VAYFDWKEDYSVGISSIDTHHKKMIGLLNESIEAFENGLGEPAIRGILSNLEQYSIYHFSQEEILFQEQGYKKVKGHGKEHELYIRKIGSLKALASSREDEAFVRTAESLMAWLEAHILKDDRDYADFIKRKDGK